MPLFTGTNSEYDTIKAFEDAGADVESIVFSNITPKNIGESVVALEKAINQAQILVIASGFSSGDEALGSGKYGYSFKK